MGRCRRVSTPGEGHIGKRCKRTRTALIKGKFAAADLDSVEGKRPLYHCNYCNKDISGKIRIKCAACPDFDLCVECFSVGAEVAPHKSNHPYRVMDKLSFPLLCPDWNAEEEILLLEAIELYGLEDKKELAEHVGTKTYDQCVEHYRTAYLNSPNYPFPDLSFVAGKNREDLLAMTEWRIEDKKEDCESSNGSMPTIAASIDEKVSDHAPTNDEPDSIERKDSQDKDQSGNESCRDSASFLMKLSRFNPRRNEFNPEYDSLAEQSIADLEFKDSDAKVDREAKLRILRAYNHRLDERIRRKEFILERNLLCPDPLLKELSPEEEETYQSYNLWMRHHSKEEHEELMRTIVQIMKDRKRVQELEEAKRAGCRTSREADIYLEQKRRKEAEERARTTNEDTQVGPINEVAAGQTSQVSPSNEAAAVQTSARSIDDWDVTGLPGSDLLSENEKQICRETRMLPTKYLQMMEVMSVQALSGNINNKSDAQHFFKTDPARVDKVYDMLVKKGLAKP